jgi:hypothetical protein
MNLQGATRDRIVSRLRAGRTMNEITSYGDFNKNTVYDDKWKFDDFIASRDLLRLVSL